jgi:ArsR family metal-binding transcriptional regulator
MTQNFYENLLRSIRNFIYFLQVEIPVFLDEIAETITYDNFIIAKSSTNMFEEGIYKTDLINVNVFTKDKIKNEEITGKLLEALQDRIIEIKDYKGLSLDVLDKVKVTDVEVTNVGKYENYFQTNLGIRYIII